MTLRQQSRQQYCRRESSALPSIYIAALRKVCEINNEARQILSREMLIEWPPKAIMRINEKRVFPGTREPRRENIGAAENN